MSRLSLFVACDRVIVSNRENLSLITLVDQIHSKPPPPGADPENVFTDQPVYVVTQWRSEPGDDPARSYPQRIRIIQPNGQEIFKPRETLFDLRRAAHVIIHKIAQFPIGLEGAYRVIVELRVDDGELEFVSDLPIIVVHQEGYTAEVVY